MKINRDVLKNALEIVKPGLANREVIEQATSFAFLDGRVTTYNDEISISTPVKGVEFTGAVMAEGLYPFLLKAPKEEIEADPQENVLLVKSGRAKVGLTYYAEINLPLGEIGKVKGWKKLPEKFMEGLKFAQFSCARDMAGPLLTCVNVKAGGIIEASDGFRLTQYDVKEKIPGDGFLIPAKSVRELARYDVKEIATTDGWVHFRDKAGTMFSCRVLEEAYPNVSSILNMGKDPIDFEFPEDVMGIVERAQIFGSATGCAAGEASTRKDYLTVVAKGRKLTFKSRSDGGWFEEWTAIQSGPTFAFQVRAESLKDVLKRGRSCKIADGVKIGFKGDDWAHIIALVAGGEDD